MTVTVAEINKVAQLAINGAFDHYFTNLASGKDKIDEAKFTAILMQETQPWLFFTEDAMEELVNKIYKDVLNINFVYTLSALFRQRFVLETSDYDRYIQHLAESFHVQHCTEDTLSMMAKEYRDRMTKPDAIAMMLTNNRMLVMIVTMMLYLDTNILGAAMLEPRR